MFRTFGFSILICFLTYHSTLTATLSPDGFKKENVVQYPEPSQNNTTTPPPPPTSTNATTSTTTAPTSTSTSTTTSSTTAKPTVTTPPSSTTSTPPPTSSSTSVPTTTHAPKPQPKPDRSFDAYSFLGGFILGLGVIGIAFLAYKFYLSRNESYYHTL